MGKFTSIPFIFLDKMISKFFHPIYFNERLLSL